MKQNRLPSCRLKHGSHARKTFLSKGPLLNSILGWKREALRKNLRGEKNVVTIVEERRPALEAGSR